jgi:hypothetical protein
MHFNKKEKKRKEKLLRKIRIRCVWFDPQLQLPCGCGSEGGTDQPSANNDAYGRANPWLGWAGHLGRQPFCLLLCPSPHLLSGSLASAADD